MDVVKKATLIKKSNSSIKPYTSKLGSLNPKFTDRGKYLFFPIILILFLCNCTNGKFTETTAEEILKTQYLISKTSNIQLSDLSLSPGIPQELKFLESKGLATYNYIPPGTPGYGCYGRLTANGSKYLAHVISKEYVSMVTAKIGFDKITGIREIPQENAAEVEYTEKIVEITPVGEMFNDLQMGQTYSKKAVFIKYNGITVQPEP